MKFVINKADEAAIDQGCYFDQESGERVVRFLEKYISLSTTNKPLKLYPFQMEMILRLFGWLKKDGTRRYSRCLLTTAKKSYGKTTICAAIALYLLMADGVNAPGILMGATTKEQAGEMFRECVYAVKNNPFLADKLILRESTNRIVYPKKSGTLKAISSEAPSFGGINASAVILDELALGTADLYEMLKSSMTARKNPLMFLLSNAGWRKDHFYYEEIYKPAKDILENKSEDTSLLPIIYELGPLDDWKDRSKLVLANPALQDGGWLTQANFDVVYQDALRTKAAEIHYRRFHCNQWLASKNSWLNLDEWDACKGNFPDLTKHSCFVGVDLSYSYDLTSIAAIWVIDGKYYVKSYNFTTETSCSKKTRHLEKEYNQFVADGSLVVCEGDAIDYDQVKETITNIPGHIEKIVLDRHEATQFAQDLEKLGYDCVFLTQNAANLNEPCIQLEKLIKTKKIVHDGNTVLRWGISTVGLETKADGCVLPVRQSESMKIDAVAALLDALSQAMLKDSEPSYLETHGVCFF